MYPATEDPFRAGDWAGVRAIVEFVEPDRWIPEARAEDTWILGMRGQLMSKLAAAQPLEFLRLKLRGWSDAVLLEAWERVVMVDSIIEQWHADIADRDMQRAALGR